MRRSLVIRSLRWLDQARPPCRFVFEVDDLDAEISRLESKNVKFAMRATDTPVCRFAIICDPDGNKIMVHKRKAC